MIRACVLFSAGTNCDIETAHALELAGAEPDTVHVNVLKQNPRRLRDYQLLVLPGGFSYGDYIASGRILASEIVHNLRHELLAFHQAGKPILGICNGFQVLVKCGLLPAFEALFETQTVTLDSNDSGRYEDRWVHLRTEPSPCVFTKNLEPMCFLPVAHAEGKLVAADRSVTERLERQQQVVFRYVTADNEEADYPENPNGSTAGIAAICDPSGLIMGMMPHPERYIRPEHHPYWHRGPTGQAQGIRIFENAVAHVHGKI